MHPNILQADSHSWQKLPFNQNFEYHMIALASCSPSPLLQESKTISRVSQHIFQVLQVVRAQKELCSSKGKLQLWKPPQFGVHSQHVLTLLQTYSTISIPTSKYLPLSSFFSPQQSPSYQKNYRFSFPPSEAPPDGVSCITSGHNKIRATPVRCANLPAIRDALGLSV